MIGRIWAWIVSHLALSLGVTAAAALIVAAISSRSRGLGKQAVEVLEASYARERERVTVALDLASRDSSATSEQVLALAARLAEIRSHLRVGYDLTGLTPAEQAERLKRLRL